jgi:hypothetical protein
MENKDINWNFIEHLVECGVYNEIYFQIIECLKISRNILNEEKHYKEFEPDFDYDNNCKTYKKLGLKEAVEYDNLNKILESLICKNSGEVWAIVVLLVMRDLLLGLHETEDHINPKFMLEIKKLEI